MFYMFLDFGLEIQERCLVFIQYYFPITGIPNKFGAGNMQFLINMSPKELSLGHTVIILAPKVLMLM